MFRRLWCVLPFFLIACKDSPPGPPPNTGPDTTSHTFVFDVDTLGDGNASYLADVFVMSETDVWATGQYYLSDTSGGFSDPPYNVARWNGSGWQMMRVPFPQYNFDCTLAFFSSALARTVFGFADGSVIMSDGAAVLRIYNGSVVQYPCIPSSVRTGIILKLWGTSASNFYAVGQSGMVLFFDGTTWQKLNSGTTVDIQDIWGATDPTNGELVILAVASFVSYGNGLDILRINPDKSVTKMDTVGLRIAQSSVWFQGHNTFYIVGDGVFTKEALQDSVWRHDTTHPLLYKNIVRGSARNDVFIAGAFGLLSHYNGSSWQHYQDVLPLFNGNWYSAAVKNDFVVVVGRIDEKAVALRGNRQ